MTVYLDLIWLLNAGIDYLLLAGTAMLLKRRFQHIRMIIGALFASLIVFFMFTPYAALFMNPVIKLIYSGAIVFIAFGYKRFSYFLKSLATFYFITFVTGGGLFAMHYFFQTEADILAHLPGYGLGGSAISWLFVLIGFPVVFLFSKQQVYSFQLRKMKADQLAEVEIWIAGEHFLMWGLVDTGNQLKDPITKMPVMVAEASMFYRAFGQKEVDAVVELTTEENPSILMKRVRVVPFKAVGQGEPFMAALKPDRVRIQYDGETFETSHVLIGLFAHTLSADEEYQCIVHPQLVVQSAS